MSLALHYYINLISIFYRDTADAFEEAYHDLSIQEKKTIPIVSAGNHKTSDPSIDPQCPAGHPSVITVGSVSKAREWSYFSSGRCKADIAANGEKIPLKFQENNVIMLLLFMPGKV
jgi:hypothetical protein